MCIRDRLKERVTLVQWIGIALGFIGTVLVIGYDIGKTIPVLGVIASIVALLGATTATIWQKKFTSELTLSVNNFYQAIAATLFLIIVSFVFEVSFINFEKQNEKWVGSGNLNKNTSEIERLYKALVLGLRDYVNNNKFSGVVLGLSGGIDSALVAAIATDAFGPEKVQAIMLPSPFTGNESLNDAKDAANFLKIKFSNLEINEAMKIIDKTLGKFNGKNFSPGVTEENIQSRLRGLLLMACLLYTSPSPRDS